MTERRRCEAAKAISRGMVTEVKFAAEGEEGFRGWNGRQNQFNTATQGVVMSIAKRISQFDSVTLQWLEIEDEDGGRYHFAKKGPAPDLSTAHVEFPGISTPPVLILAKDGKPILRQDPPGLPQKIVVERTAFAPGPPGLPVAGGWTRKIEYGQ
jgi:hypothetical protein